MLLLKILLVPFQIFTKIHGDIHQFVFILSQKFSHLSPMLLTPVIRKSPQIFVKIRNGPHGILRCPGETDSWKNLNYKIYDRLCFNDFSFGEIFKGIVDKSVRVPYIQYSIIV
jgi:hypothetical protein